MTDLTTQRQLLKSKQDELSQALSKSTAFMSLMGDFPGYFNKNCFKRNTRMINFKTFEQQSFIKIEPVMRF